MFVLVSSILSMIFFIYFATLTSFKIDFKHHFVNSTLNTASSYVGLIMSILSFIGFCYLYTTMFIVGYSFLPMCFAMAIGGNAINFNVSQLKNQKADKITRIIAIILAVIGIILSFITGQFI